MSLDLSSKIPYLNKVRFLKKYQEMLDQIEFEIDALLWILFSVAAFIAICVMTIFYFQEFFLIGFTLAIVVGDLMLGYPYLKAVQRIDAIEEALPDSLKQMADILKAGGTIEFALREVAYAEYGPLKDELFEVLRKLEEGENFATALSSLSQNVNSRVVKRTVTIIIDSIKAGAGLADILDEIAEDVRETHRIAKERKTRTLLQVIFMVVAGGAIAPIIFGFVGTISKVLLGAGQGLNRPEVIAQAVAASTTITFGMQFYMIVQVIAASTMVSLMREGRVTNTVIYFPILLFIAVVCYTLASIISGGLVGVG